MSLSFARIENLAKRLGVSFREAARRCGRKGARLRRERAAMRASTVPPGGARVRYWWQEAGDE